MAKVTVVREQPVQPPIEKIILELTPAEFRRVRFGLCASFNKESEALYTAFVNVSASEGLQ
jgi:hypothetical protein